MKFLLSVSRLIDALNERIGRLVYWLVLVMVLVSAGNATSRYVFSIASNAWLELQWYLLADIHERLEQQRDLRQRGRPDPLARTPSGSGRLLPAVAAGRLRADQAHRISQGPHSGSAGKARGPAGARHRARRSRKMTQFLIANMAPLMFAALVVFLLFGYPVSFALAAIG